MKSIGRFFITEKQKRYADEYILTHDPIKAYVKAGYVSTVEEAKKQGVYYRPLRTKAVQDYLNSKTMKNRIIKRELKITEDLLKMKEKKKVIDYSDDSYLGVDCARFLKDVINNEQAQFKDRLKAVEILYKIKGGYLELNNNTPIIINNFQKELYNQVKNNEKHITP